MKSIKSKTFLFIVFGLGWLSLTTSCQRCYTCTGEITSSYVNPFTGELVQDTAYDVKSICGTGKAGTKSAVESMESSGYDCVRTE